MTQGCLPLSEPRAAQRRHLRRVSSALATPILAFCAARLASGDATFHMADLVQAVGASASPDSPSRILRDLRQKGAVNYEVVSRRESLYRLMAVTR